jgi:hypothetical protein
LAPERAQSATPNRAAASIVVCKASFFFFFSFLFTFGRSHQAGLAVVSENCDAMAPAPERAPAFIFGNVSRFVSARLNVDIDDGAIFLG